MPRARGIKPGFFQNDELAELPFETRLLFIGLWTLADREGRLENRPLKIKMALFPADNVNVAEMLGNLSDLGMIKVYEAAGKKIIEVCNFLKHQQPHGTERDSELPNEQGFLTVNFRTSNGYITGNQQLVNCVLTVRQPLDNSSTTDEPQLDNGSKTVKKPVLNALIPDSCLLIPDSCLLTPDSCLLIPEENQSQNLSSVAFAPPAPKPAKPKKKPEEPPTAEVWQAYCDAFYARYGIEPDRDAKVNAQLSQVLRRYGTENAPHIARFYLSLNHRQYLEKRHSIGLFLLDSESIRTNWKLGQGVTAAQAIEGDKQAQQRNVLNRVLAKIQSKSEVMNEPE
jgi:hypothetical protein